MHALLGAVVADDVHVIFVCVSVCVFLLRLGLWMRRVHVRCCVLPCAANL